MIDLPPPVVWQPSRPAIIQAVEPWQKEVHRKLAALGIDRRVRLAVVSELKRLEGVRSSLVRASIDEVARYADSSGLLLAILPGMFPAGSVAAAPPSGASWGDGLATQTFGGASSSGWNTYNIRVVIFQPFLKSGTKIRITFRGSTLVITDCAVGHYAGSGDVYDHASSVPYTFGGGNAGVTLSSGVDTLGDEVNFTFAAGTNLVVAMHTSSGVAVDQANDTLGETWYKVGASAVDTGNVTGYTKLTGHGITAIKRIEVYG